MKPYSLKIVFLLVSIVGYSQTTPAKQDTIPIVHKKPNQIQSIDIGQFLPQITPKSPNIAAAERYGEIPVSLNTGIADIKIPVYEISAGSIKLPIYFSYHSGGNRVADDASWVGQGWSLQAGGSISRNIRGKADEDTGNQGVLGQELFNLDAYQSNMPCLTEQLKIDLELFSENAKDLERDIFSVNMPSKNNSFALLPNQTLWLESDKSKIEYTSGLQSIKLTDENGIRYNFADKESTDGYTSAWQLTEIQGSKPIDKIVFSYQDNGNIPTHTAELTDYEVYHTDISGLNSDVISGGLISQTNSGNTPFMSIRLLNTIYFPNGKIKFNTSPNREDNLGKSLSNIEIYSFNVSTNSYSLIKKVILNQSYKDDRLFLDSLDSYGNDGVKIGSYTCNYNTIPLPDKLSRSKDYWGFYNGKINTTLIPTQTFQAVERTTTGVLNTYNVGGANRTPDELYMQARILTKLTYPTGGFSTFEYEAHRHDGGQLAGGLRIKKIISDDGNSRTIIRTYKYGTEESGDGLYRNVTPFTYSTVQRQKHPANGFYSASLDEGKEYYYDVRIFSSAFITPQNPREGSPVTYSQVSEYEDMGSGINGKKVYEYEEGNGDDLVNLPSTAKNFYRSRAWTRGYLLSKTEFGADGKKKHHQQNTYTNLVSGVSPTLGYLINKSEVQLNYYTVDGSGCLQNYSVFNPIRPTYWYYGLKKLIKTEEYFYDESDTTQYVYKKSETDYNTANYQPQEVRSYDAYGKTHIQKLRYVTDFNTSSNSGTALALMKDNNQISTPIEVYSLVKLPNETENRVLNGQLTSYTNGSFGGQNYVYPKEVYLFEKTTENEILESAFTPASLTSGTLSKDASYEKRLVFDSYDTYGHLLSYKMDDGVSVSYNYTTIPKDSVFHGFVNSETKNGDGVNNYSSQYGYEKPLLGLSEVTSPNGLKTYFEFDNFGRLKRTKDHDGHILKEYEYKIGQGNNYTKEMTALTAMTSLSGNYTNYQTVLSYFDGLGRPLQQVAAWQSPSAKDWVIGANTLDDFGRTDKTYLPTPMPIHQDVAYDNTTILSQAQGFYGDSKPYSKINYEASPLNRVKESYGAGRAWYDSLKASQIAYHSIADSVQYYYTDSSKTIFKAYSLKKSFFKTTTIDEQGNQQEEYKDLDGNIVAIEKGVMSSLPLRYIYDNSRRLQAVVQPRGSYVLDDVVSLSPSSYNWREFVFFNEYDSRGNICQRKLASSNFDYFVYDRWNRLALSQTSLQREQQKWTFYKYDAQDRQIMRGELSNDSRSFAQAQTDALAVTQRYESRNKIAPTFYTNTVSPVINTAAIQQLNYYDDYEDWLSSGMSFDASKAFHSQYVNTWGLAVGSKTQKTETGDWLVSAQYYDNKGRVIQTFSENHNLQIERTDVQYSFSGAILQSRSTHKYQAASSELTMQTQNEYDHGNRVQKTKHGINGNLETLVQWVYDEAGRPKQKIILPDGSFQAGGTPNYINRPPSPNANIDDVARKAVCLLPGTEIDANNLTKYSASINPNADAGTALTGLQKIDYQYHIRGGLRGINLDINQNLAPNTAENDLFSYKLDYESGLQWDGNISQQSWQHVSNNSPEVVKKYNFLYDTRAQLQTANYEGEGSEDFSLTNMYYDENGNIVHLERHGSLGNGSYGVVDNLSYTYRNPRTTYGLRPYYGNRLVSVDDQVTGNTDIGDYRPKAKGTNVVGFTYYSDGSLKSDYDQNIDSIAYNAYLKQPIALFLHDGRKIKHYYDGGGNLYKTLYLSASNAVVETWEYFGGTVYKNGQPYQMTTPEGRAIYTPLGAGGGTWQYEFDYKDHLGNTRVSFKSENGQLVQTAKTDFDPLGAKLATSVANPVQNRFEYQGKESEQTFSLNRINLGARSYNATIGRMDRVDALADLMQNYTPYHANFNNPVRFIDPDGNAPDDFTYSDGYSNQSERNITGNVAFSGFSTSGSKEGGGGDETKKTVMVAFGGLDAGSKKETGVAGEIINNLNSWSKKNKKNFVGKAISSSWGDNGSINEAVNFIRSNYEIGGNSQLIIYGYSWGGDNAVELAELLEKVDIQIDNLITIDAAKGPVSGAFGTMTDFVDRKIPSNVLVNSNFYEKNVTRFPWSVGGENIRSNKSTTLYNIKYSGSSINHYTIDEATKSPILNYLKKWINR